MYMFLLAVAGVYVGYKILRHIADYGGDDGGVRSSARSRPDYDNNSFERTNGVSQNSKDRSQSQSKPPQSSSEPLSSSSKTSPPSSQKPATSPSNLPQSFSKPSLSSSSSSLSSTKAPPSSSNLSQKSSPTPATSSSKQSSSSPKPATSNLSQSFSEPQSSSSSGPNPLPSFKTTLSPASQKPATSPSNLSQSFSKPSLSSSSSSLSSTKAPPSSSNPSQKSSPTPATSSYKQSSSSPKPATSNLSQSFSEPPSYSSSPSSSSSGPNPLPSFKTTLSPASPDLDDQHMMWCEKSTSPTYKIPKDIEDLIKKDIVPGVLKMPLSQSTYKDYFAALLYAEDYYVEKWSDFKLENVTLEVQKVTVYKTSNKNGYINEKDDKIFVAFEIENVPEKRPFLLSRDFVFARPSGRIVEPFQGILNRVEKGTLVLVEFGEDFHDQHVATRKYDVSFSFNRVCLKRAHQAIAAASDSIFRNFIFPNNLSCYHELHQQQKSAVSRILSFQGPPPYLVQGPLCVKHSVPYSKELSWTGLVVQEAALQIYRSSPESRILICAPLNKTCDVLMKSLIQDIRESDIFRANAAFRELDGVPIDILPYCPYKKECFVCPPLQQLQKFRVILSTFVSSFRLHNEGITAGHFTHIFLVDSSLATEPETMVTLANLADEKTVVVVTGAPGNSSGLVRSDIARRYGLRRSYFERLHESNPSFISQLDDY